MTKFYHGSLIVVDKPQILVPTRTLDFGAGFYTTSSDEQARKWVLRKMNANNPVGYLNHYEVDLDALRKELNVLWFEKPDESWLDFVMANRTDRKFLHDYDAIYGPVANDKVYTAFALYESGVFDKESLIRELRAYKLVDQLLFHTENSLNYIHFNKSEEIRL